MASLPALTVPGKTFSDHHWRKSRTRRRPSVGGSPLSSRCCSERILATTSRLVLPKTDFCRRLPVSPSPSSIRPSQRPSLRFADRSVASSSTLGHGFFLPPCFGLSSRLRASIRRAAVQFAASLASRSAPRSASSSSRKLGAGAGELVV